MLAWILVALVIFPGIPLLCLFAGDDPRSDDPPDTSGDDGGPAVLPSAA